MGLFGFGKKEKDKMKDGLEKTRTGFWGNILNTLTGSKIDDDLYDELEEQLILADVGGDVAMKLVDALRDRVQEKGLKTGEQAADALRDIIADEMRPEAEMALDGHPAVILVIGVNGVGKTTTAVNLGVGLASSGKRVLLVDADPQGSLTVSLGIKNPDELDVSLSSLMQSVIDDEPLAEGAIIRHQEGVDLLPSNIELSGMETGLFNVMSREYVLKNAIDGMRKSYDYILIDCMPSLGMMTVNALVAADSVIIPSQPNFLSTKGLNLLLRSISKIKRQINPRLKIDGILLTMVDNRTNNAKAIISSLRSTVGENIRVFRSEIPFSVRAAECSLSGESIFSHDRNGKVAAAYEALTKEVTEIEERAKNRSGPDRVR